ncbi:MAG TPA: hypothetical protein VFV92_07295 [Candidatus Bathyarchaeia archaeon]|nr:hypothetical protein [Candidatus Bathyarchaeia archaeon]
MPKFMQSLGTENYARLLTEAKARDVTVQALIRTVIVPEWLKTTPQPTTSLKTTPTALTIQPNTMLVRTGISTDQTRRPFLNTSLGRVRS